MASLLDGAANTGENFVMAEKFTINKGNLQSYTTMVSEGWDGQLPEITETVTWTVYQTHSSKKFSHHSLLFVPQDSMQYQRVYF